MPLADLMQRSTVRLAGMVIVMVLAALLLAGGVGFGLMHAKLAERQDVRVMEMFDGIAPWLTGREQSELIEVIASRIAASPDKSSIYILEDAVGAILATNVDPIAPPPGWSTMAAEGLGIVSEYPYRLFRGTLGDYTLTVGLSNSDIDDLIDIMGGALGWSALIIASLTMVFGTFLALRMQRRLTMMDETLLRVSHGDLTARLPVTQSKDDLDRIASSINATLTRLEANVTAIRQVSTDIAHDLRTPLNRLRIRLERAADHDAAGQPISEDLTAAMEESDRINSTFAALLRISQIEAGARAARFEVTDLTGILDNVVSVYRDVAEDQGQILGPFAARPALIRGDADLLTQMFANLIENAIRHCPAGSRIDIDLDTGPARTIVRVADTGPGIPAGEREKVLQRLYRMDQSRATPGFGLGLSLVKAIAELHRATLTMGNTRRDAPVGLTVEIVFPAPPLPVA